MIRFTLVRRRTQTRRAQALVKAAVYTIGALARWVRTTRWYRTRHSSSLGSSNSLSNLQSHQLNSKSASSQNRSSKSRTWTITRRTTTRPSLRSTGTSKKPLPQANTLARSRTTQSTAGALSRRCRTIQSWTSARVCSYMGKTISCSRAWSRRSHNRATRRNKRDGFKEAVSRRSMTASSGYCRGRHRWLRRVRSSGTFSHQ